MLGLSVGDELTLAGQAFTIRGVVTRDRVQRSGGIAFGPRVYVDLADLRATPLLGFGSRATYQLFLRVDEASVNRAHATAARASSGATIGQRAVVARRSRIGSAGT